MIDPGRYDGRNERREQNRLAALDAVIDLFGENNLEPSPQEVAQRSGVSIRSVYRYYSDPDELLRAAIERHHERIAPLIPVPGLGEGPLDERVDRIIHARLRLYAATAATARGARMASRRSEEIRHQQVTLQRELRLQVERHFERELTALRPHEASVVAQTIDLLFQLESLDYFRVDRRLSRQATADALRVVILRLLGVGDHDDGSS
jgi:AcrR family transcriptional regulator